MLEKSVLLSMHVRVGLPEMNGKLRIVLVHDIMANRGGNPSAIRYLITTAGHPRRVDVSDGVEILLPRVPLALHHTGDRAVVLGRVIVNVVVGVPLGGRDPEEYDRQKT